MNMTKLDLEVDNILAGVANQVFSHFEDYSQVLRSMASNRSMVQRATQRVQNALATRTAESLDYMEVY